MRISRMGLISVMILAVALISAFEQCDAQRRGGGGGGGGIRGGIGSGGIGGGEGIGGGGGFNPSRIDMPGASQMETPRNLNLQGDRMQNIESFNSARDGDGMRSVVPPEIGQGDFRGNRNFDKAEIMKDKGLIQPGEGLQDKMAVPGKIPSFDRDAAIDRIEGAKDKGIISDKHRDPSRWQDNAQDAAAKFRDQHPDFRYADNLVHPNRPYFKYPYDKCHWWNHHYYPWRHANWAGIAVWCGLANTQPIYYNYYVVNDVIYCNGTVIPTGDEYNSALSIADSAEDTSTDEKDEWMPLGIFAVTEKAGEKAGIILQLAASKDNNIEGTYDNLESDIVENIAGAIDKKKQIAAWQIGEGDDAILMSTAIGNLTKDSSTVLVFFNDQSVESWTLTRLGESEAKSLMNTEKEE